MSIIEWRMIFTSKSHAVDAAQSSHAVEVVIDIPLKIEDGPVGEDSLFETSIRFFSISQDIEASSPRVQSSRIIGLLFQNQFRLC